jgi:hypothetical protein
MDEMNADTQDHIKSQIDAETIKNALDTQIARLRVALEGGHHLPPGEIADLTRDIDALHRLVYQ